MAGTLTISTLSDGTNSTSSTNCIQGSAKAWVRFTGATGGILASYNVSSVTRSAAGQYVVNFTNALSDALFSTVATAPQTSNGTVYLFMNYGTQTTTSVLIATSLSGGGGGALVDPATVSVACFR